MNLRTAGARTVTMATAYLISRGYSLNDALSLIERARPFIV
ncbi:MAG: hypothetical protein BroJett021_51370 [Chloroflexota bacterium]|nr:MAG: hypothetical protein BroJett021_51370 [Chloroflexota bacterium]